nr:AraC family transcriptional regulator [Bacillus suaedae]
MTANEGQAKYGVYGFRFFDTGPNHVANLRVVGREELKPGDLYDWHGLKRKDVDTYVFQYTIAGFGMIDMDGMTYSVEPGEAFVVKVPSEHRYYFPEESKGWDFVFLTLEGHEAAKCWELIGNQQGPVIKVPPDSKLIDLVFEIYQSTKEDKITDPYYASAKAYEFIMEGYRFVRSIEEAEDPLSQQMTKALSFIHSHYHEPLTLDEIASVSGYSRFYFIKQFKQKLKMPPMQYLTKIRIQKAVGLLRSTDATVTDISEKVGFSNANYFNKVFRKTMGVSAGAFRDNKHSIGIDHLIIDKAGSYPSLADEGESV